MNGYPSFYPRIALVAPSPCVKLSLSYLWGSFKDFFSAVHAHYEYEPPIMPASQHKEPIMSGINGIYSPPSLALRSIVVAQRIRPSVPPAQKDVTTLIIS